MKEIIIAELDTILRDISGIETSTIDTDTNFLMFGLDSLMIVRIGQKIQKRFGIELKISQFYEEASSFNKLVEYLVQKLSDDWVSENKIPEDNSPKPNVSPQKSIDRNPLPLATDPLPEIKNNQPDVRFSASASMLESLMSQQMQAMSRLMTHQLDVLKGIRGAEINIHGIEEVNTNITESTDASTSCRKSCQSQAVVPGASVDKNLKLRSIKFEEDPLTPQQQDYLNQFITRYVARTKKSKELTQKNRPVLSDWIASLGFRLSLKELKYPITVSRASGSKLWDIDGNEYFDVAVGYGVSFFGNSVPFIIKAIEDQLNEGFELGPQTPLAGEAAQLISDLTGVERVTFCNTGSEAVMAAMRVARLVTRRKKIVQFIGSYHGIFDGVLIEPDDDSYFAHPSSPGTPPGMTEDMIILPYGLPESVKIIKAHAHELAAILVEPVQSRRPGFQPREFLHELREITLKHGICLIFDELITGFRIAPGGAQEHFDIKADLVTYGKIVGGGMPIGVVAGKAEYMDALDGGMWKFGDNSYPHKEVTVFAGTFCKHPLSMAASRAVLRYMKEQGPGLQEQVNHRTDYFRRTLNEFFEKENVSLRINNFGSLFKFETFGKYHLLLEPIEMNLFFHILLEKGIYTWERHICFLSAAHTDEDVELIIRAMKDSIKEMKANGFWSNEHSAKSDKKKTLETDSPRITANCYPMSSGQSRIFFLDKLDAEKTGYRITLAYQIKGKLDFQRLEDAFAKIIKRHDSLRSSFKLQNGKLIQQVHEQLDFTIHYKDGSANKIDELIQNFQQPFDLEKAPLLKVCIVTLSEQSCLMILDTHHIAIDGMSLNILVKEIALLYEGNPLPLLPQKYRDFLVWHQEQLHSETMNTQKAYWLKTFSNEIPSLNLPLDYPRPPTRSSKGDIIYSHLSKDTTEQLKTLARNNGVTLTMILLGAYNVLLHRLTNQKDIIVGMPVSGRPADFENVLGMFANTIVIRNQPKTNYTFIEFLKTVKANALKAYDHQDYPFELLVDNLNLERDLSRNPLFDAMFTYERADDRLFRIKDLSVTPYEIKVDTSMMDLDLETIEQGGMISLTLAYNTDLFKRDTIERWLGYYEKIIEEMLKNPDQKISEIELLSHAEKNRLIVELNDSDAAFPKDKTIVDLFEEQVKKTPNNIAVIYPMNDCEGSQNISSLKDIRLTYKELNEQADQIADYLRKKYHIQPEDRVGLLSDRSEQMVVGALGIMKAGAAYVPVDALYPQERIQYILENSNCKVILTTNHKKQKVGLCKSEKIKIPTNMTIPTVDMNEIRSQHFEIRSNDLNATRKQLAANNLAYVIYTSGSTGLPKGVMVEHQNLVNMVGAYRKAYGLDMFDVRLLQLASMSFDVFAGDMLRALMNGGQMLICPTETRIDLVGLYHLMARYQVNIFESTPALILPLMDYIFENTLDISFLKVLITSSDSIQTKHFKQLIERFARTGMRIINTFGITETTIDSSYFEMTEAPNITPQNVLSSALTPIGRPLLQNTQFYIFPPEQCSTLICTPTGVQGELFIGGAGVARGYLNNDTLTAERFIPNPFRPGERMYKTGDIARWLSNGNLEYFGRMDNQVQVRGYRVELEEIEKQILKHENIKEVVVLAMEMEEGLKDLVAYVVCPEESETLLSIADLRTYLTQFLSEYMIPGFFVFLKKLPLTPNGKIDRKALPIPDKSERSLSSSYEPPRTNLEKDLAQIWEDVLDRKRIGIHDNFFELGGHSIKVIHMVSKIHTKLGISVKLQDIFRSPTIAELTDKIKLTSATFLQPIQPLAQQTYYELSSTQKGFWLIDQMDKDGIANNMHGAFLFEGEIDADAFEKAIKNVTVRHESFRTVFITVNGEPKQKILDESDFFLEKMDLSNEKNPEKKAYEYYMKEADSPFDLEKGPLFRMTLLKLNTIKQSNNQVSKHVLFFNINHIIYDGWTEEIIFKEISNMYSAYQQGKNLELPPLRIHYKDYAAWINQLETSDAMKPHQEYWLSKLSDNLPVLDFPLDFPRPEVQRFKGKYAKFSVDRKLTEDIIKLTTSRSSTLFMTLVGSINTLLYCHTLQKDIIVGVPATGRVHPDLENQAGCYLNMIPLRNKFDHDDTLNTVLNKVRKTATEAYEHEIYPYNRLVVDLNLSKNMSRNHLFDVIVNVVNFEPSSLKLDNVKISPFAEDSSTSRADLDFIFLVDDQLELTIEYDTALFREETIHKIGNCAIEILKIFANNMDMTLNQIKDIFMTSEQKNEEHHFLESLTTIDEDF
ncbi:MAG: amino acid adenylation domain-containing protein [Candidatus Magnetomorum sp.]|nr:amino acid adenylation domain-containing protein [Candidatus Magnetomorum sp.]